MHTGHDDHSYSHDHEHMHAHGHEHTHVDAEGHEYTHVHEDTHVHAHEHSHKEGQAHTHTHEHDHAHGSHDHEHVTPRDELKALRRYMGDLNAAHAAELADLASKVHEMGEDEVYADIMRAVAGYEENNLLLANALKKLG